MNFPATSAPAEFARASSSSIDALGDHWLLSPGFSTETKIALSRVLAVFIVAFLGIVDLLMVLPIS